jgi:hypothetical protein
MRCITLFSPSNVQYKTTSGELRQHFLHAGYHVPCMFIRYLQHVYGSGYGVYFKTVCQMDIFMNLILVFSLQQLKCIVSGLCLHDKSSRILIPVSVKCLMMAERMARLSYR